MDRLRSLIVELKEMEEANAKNQLNQSEKEYLEELRAEVEKSKERIIDKRLDDLLKDDVFFSTHQLDYDMAKKELDVAKQEYAYQVSKMRRDPLITPAELEPFKKRLEEANHALELLESDFSKRKEELRVKVMEEIENEISNQNDSEKDIDSSFIENKDIKSQFFENQISFIDYCEKKRFNAKKESILNDLNVIDIDNSLNDIPQVTEDDKKKVEETILKEKQIRRLYSRDGLTYRFNRGLLMVDGHGKKVEHVLDGTGKHHVDGMTEVGKTDFNLEFPDLEVYEDMKGALFAINNGLSIVLLEGNNAQIFLPDNVTQEMLDQLIPEIEARDDFVYAVVRSAKNDLGFVAKEDMLKDEVLGLLRGMKVVDVEDSFFANDADNKIDELVEHVKKKVYDSKYDNFRRDNKKSGDEVFDKSVKKDKEDKSEEQEESVVDKPSDNIATEIIFDDINSDMSFIHKATLEKFDIIPIGNAVKINGQICYPISLDDVNRIIEGQNNSLSPYVVEIKKIRKLENNLDDKLNSTSLSSDTVDKEKLLPPGKEEDSQLPIKDSDSQPPEKDPDPQPPEKDPDPQPPEKDSDPQPPEKDPDPQPPEKDPDPQPPEKDSDPQPPEKDPEPQPPEKDSEPQPPEKDPDDVIGLLPPGKEPDKVTGLLPPGKEDPKPPIKEPDPQPPEKDPVVGRKKKSLETILHGLIEGDEVRGLRNKDYRYYRWRNIKYTKAAIKNETLGDSDSLVYKAARFFRLASHSINGIASLGMKLAGSVLSSETSRKKIEIIRERLAELSKEDLLTLREEYRGSKANDIKMLSCVDQLIIERLDAFDKNEIAGLQARLEQIIGELYRRENILNDIDKLRISGKIDAAEAQRRMNLVVRGSADLVKEYKEKNQQIVNLTSRGREEDLRAAHTGMNLPGRFFAKKNTEITAEYQDSLKETSEHEQDMLDNIVDNNDIGALDGFIDYLNSVERYTAHKSSLLFGERSVGLREATPINRQLDYREDPLLRDLVGSVMEFTAIANAASAVMHSMERQRLVDAHNAEIAQHNANLSATEKQIHQSGDQLVGHTDAYANGMKEHSMETLEGRYTTGEVSHLEQLSKDSADRTWLDSLRDPRYRGLDDPLHAQTTRSYQDLSSEFSKLGSDFSAGKISPVDYLKGISGISNGFIQSSMSQYSEALSNAQQYITTHNFDKDGYIGALNYMNQHMSDVVDMNQAMIESIDIGTVLQNMPIEHAQGLGQLPEDLLTPLITSAVLVKAATKISKDTDKVVETAKSRVHDTVLDSIGKQDKEELIADAERRYYNMSKLRKTIHSMKWRKIQELKAMNDDLDKDDVEMIKGAFL